LISASINTADRKIGEKIYEFGRVAYEAVRMLAFEDTELMDLYNKAYNQFNYGNKQLEVKMSDNQVKTNTSNNEVKMSDNQVKTNTSNNELKKHESDNQVKTNKMNTKLQSETHKLNIELDKHVSDN